MNASPSTPQRRPGWGWPITVVIIVHLGLAAIPLHFSEAHSEEPPPIRITLSTPAPTAPPQVIPEPVEEIAEAEPEAQIEPAKVVAEKPENVAVEPQVAIAQEEPIINEIKEVVEPRPEPEVAEVEESSEVEEVSEVAAIEPIPAPVREQPSLPAAEEEEESADVDWSGYGRGVMRSIQSEQRYPRMAQRRGLEGTATVRVVINRDGRLVKRPEIVDSTSHSSLDSEVVRMVEAAAPFTAFPNTAQKDEQEFVIPVRFRLN